MCECGHAPRTGDQGDGPCLPPLLAPPVSACYVPVTCALCPKASLTSQQALGDIKGMRQVLGDVQVGRLLAQL